MPSFFEEATQAMLPRRPSEEAEIDERYNSMILEAIEMCFFERNESGLNLRQRAEARRCFMRLMNVAAAFCGVVLLIGLYFWCEAIEATYEYGNKACDVPLGKYVILQLGLTWIVSTLRLQDSSFTAAMLVASVTSFLSTMVVAVGLVWLFSSTTCSNTNPALYYAVAHLLYFEAAGLLGILLLVMLAVAGRIRMENQAMRGLRPFPGRELGCPEAVQQMVIVPFNAEHPLEDEDGVPSECVICLDILSSGIPVRRTDCWHYFHEECLAQWCAGHRKCPICKRDLA